MPTQWTIPASGGVDPNTNGKNLVGCKLQQNSTNYQFEASNGSVLTTSTGTTLPLDFPVYYKTPFGGTTRLPWYIRLDTTTHGEGKNKAQGEWSNTPFPAGGKVKRTETDTWTTQAGQNTGVYPEEEASAASASSDM
jgi:hypothetical protein